MPGHNHPTVDWPREEPEGKSLVSDPKYQEVPPTGESWRTICKPSTREHRDSGDKRRVMSDHQVQSGKDVFAVITKTE